MASKPLLELLTGPWAITPEKLVEIQAVYAAHLNGGQIDIAAVEARLGRPLASEMQAYQVDTDGIARLDVNGVMAPKANLFMQVSGGTSTQLLTQQFQSLRSDARVRSAMIVWDSPGGNVQGIPAAAAALRELAAEKPTVSLVRGSMASAAYWVGSAANAVMLEGQTDIAGSLGVIQRLAWDSPEPNTMEIVRGKYKRLAVNGAGPDPDVLAAAEAQVDYLYSVLVDAVAQHRRATAADVLKHMADGRIFTGQLALDAGLADGMSTLAELTDRLATRPGDFSKRRAARIAVAVSGVSAAHSQGEPMPPQDTDPSTQATQLTRETLERDHPALFASLRTEFTAAGAASEVERIKGVRAQMVPGHEALIDQMALDGRSTAADAALAIVSAEQQLAAKRGADIAADRPAPLPAAQSAEGEGDKQVADKTTGPAASQARAKVLAQAIATKQAEARASGRNLSATEALALIQKES